MLQIPVSPIADEKVGRSAVANDKERKKMRTKSLVGVLIALLLMAGAAAVSAQDVTQAAEPLLPTNRFASPEGSIKHFVESRATTEDFLKSTPGMRDHVMESPMGKLDAYEFVLLVAAHSERHTKQIIEVKADPNFPK